MTAAVDSLKNLKLKSICKRSGVFRDPRRSSESDKACGTLSSLCKGRARGAFDTNLTSSREKMLGQMTCLSPNSRYQSRFEALNGRYLQTFQRQSGSAA